MRLRNLGDRFSHTPKNLMNSQKYVIRWKGGGVKVRAEGERLSGLIMPLWLLW